MIRNQGFSWQKQLEEGCFQEQIGRKLKKKLVKCYIWSIALFGHEIWTLRKVYQKYAESFEMWCWRRMEISWTDRERNEVLQGAREERP
jgi:hypothetical protein